MIDVIRTLAAAMLVVSCGANRDPIESPTAADLRTVASLPGLVMHVPRDAKQDCRISSVIRTRFAKQRVVACGAITPASPERDWDRMGRCIAAADRQHLPFLAEAEEDGTDSTLALATIAVLENQKLVVYRFGYDSDPCGGGCPGRGGTTVQKCVDLLSAKGGCAGADCAGCGEWVGEDPCFFGGPEAPEPDLLQH